MNSSDSDRLGDDFSAYLAECNFDRHAGFDADQQEIERIGKGSLDRELAFRDCVFEKQHRRL
jgi:hypothetical protein